MPLNPQLLNLLLFVGASIVVVALGLVAIGVVLKAQRRHKKRLFRVSRRRATGRVDIDEMRLSLLRATDDASPLVLLTERLARVVPLLDTVRLKANIGRAGMSMSVAAFVLYALVLGGLLTAALALVSGAPAALLAAPSIVAGMFLVDGFIKFRGEVMAQRFMKQLPEAIDTVIRGIRSGLPVIECIGAAGQEAPDPLGAHLRSISERVQLGETLESALWRVARVVNKPEMDFMAISISIQIETGGSLAEALGNLSDLLRKREHMKLKIKAVSSEAKASAMIIGALPFVMLGLLTMMSPDYVKPLFLDPRGQLMLGAGLLSISMGAFVMWRMTQFEI